MSAPERELPAGELVVASGGFLVFFVAFFADTMFGRVLGYGDGPGYSRPFFERARTLWTDSLFGGYPVVGDAQSGFFNPVSVVLGGLGFGFDAFVVAGYVLCAVGGFALGRVLTGSRLAGVAAGLAFSTSGFIVGQLDHVAMVHVAGWLAFALAALELLHRQGSWQAFVGLSVSVACVVLAGSFQLTAYGGAVLALVLVVRTLQRPDRLRFFSVAVLAMLGGGLLGAVALSPSLELVGMSVRSALTFENFVSNTYSPGLLPSFAFPRLFLGNEALAGLPDVEVGGFVGVVVLLVALVGAVAAPRREAWLWGAIVLGSLVLALGPSTPLPRLLFHVPLWNLFRGPSRHLFELSLGVAALTALGVAAVQRGQLSRRAVVLTAAGLIVFFAVALGLLWFSTPRAVTVPLPQRLMPWADWRLGAPVLVGGLAVSLVWLGRHLPPFAAVLLVLAAGVELVAVHQAARWRRQTPADGTPPLSPDLAPHLAAATRRGERLLVLRGYWDPLVPANAALSEGVSSVSGYSPLEPRTFAEVTGIDANGQVYDPGRLVVDENVVLDLLSVGLVVIAPGHVLPPPRFEAVETLPVGALIRNTRVRPRAWFVSETVRLDGDEARAALTRSVLPDGRRFDPATVALVEKAEPGHWSPDCEARQRGRGEGWLELETSCAGPGFLVVSERGFPGWRATVDGERVPIVRTDVLISGVEVPAGSRVVTLRYSPSSLWVGVALALLGALLVVGAAVRLRRSPLRQPT